jgi:hypothetical protein
LAAKRGGNVCCIDGEIAHPGKRIAQQAHAQAAQSCNRRRGDAEVTY